MGMDKDRTIGIREERVGAVRRLGHPWHGGEYCRVQEIRPVQVPSVIYRQDQRPI